MKRKRHKRHPGGIAVASCCTDCAHILGSPDEIAPGRCMEIVHAHHIPQLEAIGWEVTRYAHEPPDVVCPHYADLCADEGDS